VNLLFDSTWFNKKESLIKKLLKIFLSKKFIDFLRGLKIKLKI